MGLGSKGQRSFERGEEIGKSRFADISTRSPFGRGEDILLKIYFEFSKPSFILETFSIVRFITNCNYFIITLSFIVTLTIIKNN